MIIGMSVFFPIVSILAMRASGLIKNLRLSEAKDRIGPMIASIIFYIWLFLNYRRFDTGPEIFEANILGATMALCFSFFINNFSKISLHAVGAGGLLGTIGVFRVVFGNDVYKILFGAYELHISPDIFLAVIVIITGMIGTSRLYLKTHKPADIYGGYLLGFVSQLMAYILIKI